MPAHRSDAELEIRTAVVERLRKIRPEARIIHEINSGAGTRIDLLAVSPDEIIAVEIKSEKDVTTRLEKQYRAMRGVAHHVIIAYHKKHDIDGVPRHCHWRYPEEAMNMPDVHGGGYDWNWKWTEPKVLAGATLPYDAIHILWKAELLRVADFHGVKIKKYWPCRKLIDAIRWTLTGKQVTLAVCESLRNRDALEADPPC